MTDKRAFFGVLLVLALWCSTAYTCRADFFTLGAAAEDDFGFGRTWEWDFPMKAEDTGPVGEKWNHQLTSTELSGVAKTLSWEAQHKVRPKGHADDPELGQVWSGSMVVARQPTGFVQLRSERLLHGEHYDVFWIMVSIPPQGDGFVDIGADHEEELGPYRWWYRASRAGQIRVYASYPDGSEQLVKDWTSVHNGEWAGGKLPPKEGYCPSDHRVVYQGSATSDTTLAFLAGEPGDYSEAELSSGAKALGDVLAPALWNEMQDLYIAGDLTQWLSFPTPFGEMEQFDFVGGECEDLPGFLASTVPITFDSTQGFSTTAPYTGAAFVIGEISGWGVTRFSHISTVRCIKDWTHVALDGKVVTAAFEDACYIEEDNRSAGIRVEVLGPTVPARGDRIDVEGLVATLGPERAILADSITITDSGQTVPRPLGTKNRYLGGGDSCYQPCVTGAWGLNNIGLLICTWGNVIEVDPGGSWFLVDDGSPFAILPPLVVLPPGVQPPALHSFAAVTGICSCAMEGLGIIPFVPLTTYIIVLGLRMERFDALRLSGVVFGLGGTALILFPDSSLPDAGSAPWFLLGLLTPIFYALSNVLAARLRPAGAHSLPLAAGMLWCVAIVLAPLVFSLGLFYPVFPPFETPELAILGQIAVSSVAYFLFFEIIRLAGPVFMSFTGYVVTLTGIGWGMVFFGESHSPFVWAAAGLIFVGMGLVNLRARAPAAPAAPAAAARPAAPSR